jgi:putative hydrolase
MADAAVAAGLQVWALSDHVRVDSDWVPDYVHRVRAMRRDGLEIRCGVEAKILDSRGRLDLPPGIAGLDHVLVADHQFPGADAPVHPRDIRGQLESGALAGDDVIDQLVAATCAAVARSPFRPVVVHPFSLLPKIGLAEDGVRPDHLAALAAACAAVGGAVEINEKWRCPSARVVAALLDLGVPLVAGSDAHRTEDVGAWAYLDEVLPVPAGTRGP